MTVSAQRSRLESVEMRGIVKRFPGVLAVDHVDFDVHAGEVHALLGENGAGKTTLMKILYGMYRPDAGEIFLNGERVHFTSPQDAIRHSIGMVHQHFMLVETLTVVENVALGLPSSRGFLTDLDRVAEQIVQLAERYRLQIDPWAYIWQLSVGQQQRVEIIKALYRGADVLILDEPTAVLTPQEVEELFQIIRQMVQEGHGIVFISHKLHEVLAISERVTVLRDGRKIGTRPTQEITKETLASWMVGRPVSPALNPGSGERGALCLRLEGVSCLNDRGVSGLKEVSLEVYHGEILGIAGVSGNGQRELAEVIAGLRPLTAGRIWLEGEEITALSPAERTLRGMAYIPEERMRDGVIREFSVAENLLLKDHPRPPFARSTFLRLKEIARHADALIDRYQIKTPSRETPVRSLSGGNIQKVVLARELSATPRFILAAQPTRGLDIGATEYVRSQLLAQRQAGVAILLISEDLDEILALADRIAVMYEGQIMDILPRAQATPEKLGLLMAGVRQESAKTGL